MVKGLSKRALVVKFPEQKNFESAVFILKDACGAAAENEIVSEARAIAAGTRAPKRAGRSAPPWVWAAAGAALVGLVWLISTVF